jgi:demethylmenaquinone methyltransferase/2-methoxy-6-polyprenyl-1,4-benzoquinol methylase
MDQKPQTPAPIRLESERAQKVHSLFSGVAGNYDKLNTLISFGIHHRWRRELVEWSGAKPGDSVLDLATGTGDLALEFKRQLGPKSAVLGTDFNAEMLRTAPDKARERGLDVKFEQADATQLVYPDNQFDIVSISYGIRNVDDTGRAVREIHRVLKPGGRFMILETGHATNPLLHGLFRVYFKHIMPRLASLLGGDLSSYQYLEASASEFPSGERLVALIRNNGNFSEVFGRPVFGGVSWMYRATKA